MLNLDIVTYYFSRTKRTDTSDKKGHEHKCFKAYEVGHSFRFNLQDVSRYKKSQMEQAR